MPREPLDLSTDPKLADLADQAALIRSMPRLRKVFYDKIRDLKAQGYTWQQLAAATGYSEQMIFRIAPAGRARRNGSKPSEETA
jgi:hypothetical protein